MRLDWKIVKTFFLDLIFPIDCLGCGKEGEWVCGDCKKNIRPDRHSLRGESLDKIFSFYSYDSEIVKELIHGLKYRFVEDLAAPLGDLLVGELEKVRGQIGQPDFIVPVPLHEKRLLERGFNQSELLAIKISERFGWPVENMVLTRSRATASQVDFDEEGRKKNIGGAFFAADREKILNKKIVLVDDVTTTGATMEECARVLKRVGAREVLGVAFAKG